MKKNILHTLMLMGTIIIIVFAMSSLSVAKDYNDLPATHWAYKYVSELSDIGTISGYKDGSFKPNKSISRAEFYKLLVSSKYPSEVFEKLKEFMNFTAWYEPYMYNAFEKGYFADDIGYGNPNDPITRKEMIIALGKVVKENNGNNEIEIKEVPFEDLLEAGISEYEMYCVNMAYTNNLIKGYNDGTFKPDNNMTRAEVATVIYRLLYGGNE